MEALAVDNLRTTKVAFRLDLESKFDFADFTRRVWLVCLTVMLDYEVISSHGTRGRTDHIFSRYVLVAVFGVKMRRLVGTNI